MRTPETIFGMLQDRGKRRVPVNDLYRQLYNPTLYLRAYGRIYANDGAMTKGSTQETADAMSLAKIRTIIDDLRQERYRWTPVRRTYVPKKNGKMRPLSLPSFTDKLLQEVICSLLEAYYEPQFSDTSHGFRPGRSCHTALNQIEQTWTGTRWLLEGDIQQCFEKLDHSILLSILAEHIHDNRFLRLIKHLLQAGYLEDWSYYPTMSGAPQGGIVSPILSNIYLNKLDQFVEKELIPRFTRGEYHKKNPAYARYTRQAARAKENGEYKKARTLLRLAQQLPSKDPYDPGYRRLKYTRYADDTLFGFIGPRAEVEQIKHLLADFLHNRLGLILSSEKTLITHARYQEARFLGYGIQTQYRNDKLATNGDRTTNGKIALRVPKDVVKRKTSQYEHAGKPVRRPSLASCTDYTILNTFQGEYRGLVQYYLRANNVHWLHRVRWAAEQSLTRTLAMKHQCSAAQMAERYQAVIQTPHGPMKCLEVIVDRENGKKPLVARFGDIPLVRDKDAHPIDHVSPPIRYERKEVVRRLIASRCELCTIKDKNCVVHQVRKLADLTNLGKQRPRWAHIMLQKRRKTLIVCQSCHHLIHDG
jgi:group II intron reverse transcriptase/maturase